MGLNAYNKWGLWGMAEDSEVDFSRLRVLLAEDEKFAQTLIKQILKQIGIDKPLLAEDGAVAQNLLDSLHGADLVISDWNMPYINGMELLRYVRRKWPDTPFLMITGTTTRALVQEAVNAGVDGFIAKPFSLEQIKSRMVAALKKRQGLSA